MNAEYGGGLTIMLISLSGSKCLPQGEMAPDADVQGQAHQASAQPGEVYFYRYVRNDPANLVDPTGLAAASNTFHAPVAPAQVTPRRQAMINNQEAIQDLLSRQTYDAANGGANQVYFQHQLALAGLQLQIKDLEERKDYAASQGDLKTEQWLWDQLQTSKNSLQSLAYGSLEASPMQLGIAYAKGAAVGAGTGAKNAVVGISKTGREIGYQAADVANATGYLLTGHEMYHGNLSQLGQASVRGDFSYGTHAAETGANILTLGVYGEAKLTYQYATGQIDLQTYSESMGAAGAIQLTQAGMVKLANASGGKTADLVRAGEKWYGVRQEGHVVAGRGKPMEMQRVGGLGSEFKGLITDLPMRSGSSLGNAVGAGVPGNSCLVGAVMYLGKNFNYGLIAPSGLQQAASPRKR